MSCSHAAVQSSGTERLKDRTSSTLLSSCCRHLDYCTSLCVNSIINFWQADGTSDCQCLLTEFLQNSSAIRVVLRARSHFERRPGQELPQNTLTFDQFSSIDPRSPST